MFSVPTGKNGRGPYSNRYSSNYQPHQYQQYQHSTSRSGTYEQRDYLPSNQYEQNTSYTRYNHFQNRDRQLPYLEPDSRYVNSRRNVAKTGDQNFRPARPSVRQSGSAERGGSSRRVSSPSRSDVNHKAYICPGCYYTYNFSSACGRVAGKVPLILNCKHTVCQDCIQSGAAKNNIVCPTCQNPSVLQNKNQANNLSEIFPPNYYIIGVIAFSKCVVNNSTSLTLVPVDEIQSLRKSNNNILMAQQQEYKEICCFASCENPAHLSCEECNDIYCKECFTNVHKSIKSLSSHKSTPMTKKKVSRELDLCVEHNMDVEFLCTECEIGACCYCLIEKHTGHKKHDLSKLNDEDLCQLQDNRGKLKSIHKQLLLSQKKVRDLSSTETFAAVKKIYDYFANLYGRLQCIEHNVLKEAVDIKANFTPTKELEDIWTNINQSIDTVANIIRDCDRQEEEKINMKKLKEDVEDALETPCYLLSENKTVDPIQFTVDPVLDKIDDYFVIEKKEVSYLRLVTADELPPDYEIESGSSQIDSDLDKSMELTSRRSNNSMKRHHVNTKASKSQLKLDNELVEVTHIESLESFYVQLKKMKIQKRQLDIDINNFIKMADTVDQPQINELYLALYVTKTEKTWCRARLMEIKNGETEPLYEVFFVDYGGSQTVDITKLKEISGSLAHPKPFAIQCELYNPGNNTWKKNAHVYMGKMINGKDIYLMMKGKNIKNNGAYIVDLLVSSSDRSLTSLVDILINTCCYSQSGESSSESSQMMGYSPEFEIFSNSTKFEKNNTEMVVIAKVIDPDHIFVHLAANIEAMKKLNTSLKIHFKNSKINNCIVVEGSYVVVEHRDAVRGNWHRALVKKVDINKETVNVLLVDWGFQVTVPLPKVKMMREQLNKMETQAILVKLAHIEPINKTNSWSENATIFLQKYFITRERLKMVVHQVDPLQVALFEIASDVDVCLNAMLVKEKHARSTGSISEKLEWPRNMALHKPPGNEEGLLAALLEKAELSESSESADEDNSIVRQQINIVKIVSPGLIYIKFVCKDAEALALHKELQVHYSKERMTQESWKPGDDCVVAYGNIYTRGKVLCSDENGYKINLYDKAEEVVFPISHIFTYMKYFNKYSNIVYKAYLANIRPAGGDTWSLSSTEALEKIFEKYKEIYATKVSGDTSEKLIPMKMWYTCMKIGSALEANEWKFFCINNKLVKLGLAYKICTMQDDMNVSSQNVDTSKDSAEVDADEEHESSEKEEDSWYALAEMEKKSCPIEPDVEVQISDWLPPILPREREFYAFITCAEKDGILYYREESLQGVYKVMENKIKQHFSNKKWKTKRKNHEWKTGDLCTIIYNDNYYRGKIYKVTDQNNITAVMIDFGSDHDVLSTDLIDEIVYPNVPPFASKLKMDRIYPKSDSWLTSDYETLLDIITEYSRVVIKGPLDADVPVAEIYTTTGQSINEILVEKCPNLTRHPKYCKSEDDDNVIIEEEVIIEYEKDLKKEGLEDAVIEEEMSIGCCDKTEIEGIEDANIEEEMSIGCDDKTEVSEAENFTFKIAPLPDSQETFQMSVVTVLTYNQVILKSINIPSACFKHLQADIQYAYQSRPVVKKFEVGAPCIALQSTDNLWYRARVHNIEGLEYGHVSIFYVDIGTIDLVFTADVRSIKAEWFEAPVNCYLATLNVEVKLDIHKEQVCQLMKKLQGKRKFIKMISIEPLIVHLLEEGGELSYQYLINSGLLMENSE